MSFLVASRALIVAEFFIIDSGVFCRALITVLIFSDWLRLCTISTQAPNFNSSSCVLSSRKPTNFPYINGLSASAADSNGS